MSLESLVKTTIGELSELYSRVQVSSKEWHSDRLGFEPDDRSGKRSHIWEVERANRKYNLVIFTAGTLTFYGGFFCGGTLLHEINTCLEATTQGHMARTALGIAAVFYAHVGMVLAVSIKDGLYMNRLRE